jgi:hypothetical protein
MTQSINTGMIEKKTWLSEKEAENYTGLGYDVLKKLRTEGTDKGILPYCRIGGTIRYRRTEIDKFFSQHTVKI